MVSVTYTHRIICDYDFLVWLINQQDKTSLFSHLLHIKSSSEQWKKCHNLILASEIKDKENPTLTNENIGAIFKIVSDPDFLINYKEQNTKNIIFSIELTDDKPFKCYLFTTPEKELIYRQNKHYNGITSLEIVSGDKAKRIINEFFSAFDYKRQEER